MEFIEEFLSQINLKENDTLYDFIYNVFFFAELKKSEEDIKNDRVMTLEEVKERMRASYANFYVR